MEIYCFMLTRGECAPQHNSLLPANQKDVLAHVQQKSPLIFHQLCSGDVSHSLLQWHWPSPGEHMAFCSTPSFSSRCLRLHQLLLSLKGSICLVFCSPDNHPYLQRVLLAFREPATCNRSCTFRLPESSRDQPDPHLPLHPNKDRAEHEGWRKNNYTEELLQEGLLWSRSITSVISRF